MRKLVGVSVVASLFACSDHKEESYATWADANRAGAVERGWLPPFVPESARDIHSSHDLDTNEQKLTFTVPAEAVRPMLDRIVPQKELEGDLVAKALNEAGWKASEEQNVVAILLCTRSYSGMVAANHRTGRTVFVSPAEWTRESCPRPL